MSSPDRERWLKPMLRKLRHPVVASLGIGLLIGLLVLQLLQSKFESDGRAEMHASLVLIQANLSVETVRAKGIGVASILGLNEPLLKEAALGKHRLDAPEVLERLAVARKYFNYEGMYIVDKQGVMVANDTDGKKSTGKSIAFRPYFQQAIQGRESVYVAVGTNSDSRGIYYAVPLYAGADRNSDIIGVVAIKTSAEFLDGLLKQFGDDSMLISPQGVVYASTRPEWLWGTIPPVSEKLLQEIRGLKQFGMRFENSSPSVLPFNPYDQDVWLNKKRFAAERVTLDLNDPQGNWSLVRLKRADAWFPLKTQFQVLGSVLLMALLTGLFLQRQRVFRISANKKLAAETMERKQAEQANLEAARRGARLAELSASMREAEDLPELSQRYFAGLAVLIGTRHGLLYIADEASATLRLSGGFGVPHERYGEKTPYGDGLAGQCAQERKPIQLDNPPSEYLRIVSGTGHARPAHVLIRPLLLNEKLVAVVELSGLEVLQETTLALLQELEPVVASCVEIIERKNRFHDEMVKQLAFQQALLDSIPNPIFYKGTDTRFLGCNKAYEVAFNVQKRDFIGKRVLDLEYLSHQQRTAYQQEDEEVIAKNGRVKRIVTLRYADGRLRSCLYWVSAFRLEDGIGGGMVGTFIELDIDEEGVSSPPEVSEQEN